MDSIVTRDAGVTTSHVVQLGELGMYYFDAPGGTPPLLLLHGLSSNANAFGGLVEAGLSPAFRVIAPDLRGRARSSAPESGYTMADHAADVLALMDLLGIDRVVLGGHSFGGYLAIYIAAHHPDRVEKLIVIDAAVATNPRTVELLKPSLDRLTQIAPSVEAYLGAIRTAQYLNGAWDPLIEAYFRAEIHENPDGTVRSATSAAAVQQALVGVTRESWLHWVQQVQQPALLLNAIEPFGPPDGVPLIDETNARSTARAFPNGHYLLVPGNHLTMMFGAGAVAIRQAIERFVREGVMDAA